MARLLGFCRWHAVVLGVLAALAFAGIAVAAGSGSQTITVCAQRGSGTLYRAKHCHRHDGKLTWNTTGPRGLAGMPGVPGVPGPAGPSDAFSGFKDGPVMLPSSLGTIASLPIPVAGNYVIFAKVVLHDQVNTAVDISCELVAGSDSDSSQTLLNGNSGGFINVETAALNVVHQYAAPGTADLMCDGFGVLSDASSIKITAIHVGSLTNTSLP